MAELASVRPLNPITDFYYAYTKDPGWSNPFLNTVHFYNATIEQLLHEEYAANKEINKLYWNISTN